MVMFILLGYFRAFKYLSVSLPSSPISLIPKCRTPHLLHLPLHVTILTLTCSTLLERMKQKDMIIESLLKQVRMHNYLSARYI